MHKNSRIDFKDLKERTRGSFPAVLAHYGIKPVSGGDQTRVRCPFHDDERPSCSVNLLEGVWNCHAGCGSGNLLGFVHRMEARDGATVSIRQAGLRLAEIAGVVLDGAQARQEGRTGAPAKKTAGPTAPGENARPGAPQREHEAVPARNKPLGFRLAVVDHPYLRERGVPEPVASLFGLTFADRGTMAGRVCVPIENVEGQLVAYAGRWAGPDDAIPEGEEKYKLPAGFHKSLELFNLHRVRRCRHLVVVEGFFGAIALHGHRVPAVALMGSSISDEQVALLVEHCPALRFVTVLMDGDKAGREAAERVAGKLAWHWPVRIGALPEGMQPDTTPLAALMHAIGRDR
jgi:DNA primase